MQAILLSREEVVQRAKLLYEKSIQEKVEQEENIGKMVIIDIETGEFGVDTTGLKSAKFCVRKIQLLDYSVLRLDIMLRC